MILRGYVVPGRPHPLLAPDAAPPWRRLRDAFDAVRDDIAASGADLLVLYSTQWPSIIGHQLQAHPEPAWTLVDEEWHELGSVPYRLRMDPAFAEAWREAARARGLHARTVAYEGFPIDTGTVVALRLLDPENRLPACVVSCNLYADRAETLVLGKACADAIARTGRKAVAVAVTALSNRPHTRPIAPEDDALSSAKDDEWNRKLLAFLAEGRLEDVSQLMRPFAAQANADSRGKAIWWLAATMGQHNAYAGTVFAYEPLQGTGAALVRLVPTGAGAGDLEFDEEDPEVFGGDRSVLAPAVASAEADGAVRAVGAPRPVGPYPHARRVGDLLFVSGMGPRQPGTDAIPGGPVRDALGHPLPYDVAAQTRATLENVRAVLAEAGLDLSDVVDVTAFLTDMRRDFGDFNRVYGEYLSEATRTTVEVGALPTPIAVELKVVAKCR